MDLLQTLIYVKTLQKHSMRWSSLKTEWKRTLKNDSYGPLYICQTPGGKSPTHNINQLYMMKQMDFTTKYTSQ